VSGAFEGVSLQFVGQRDIVGLQGLLAVGLAVRQHDGLRATRTRGEARGRPLSRRARVRTEKASPVDE